MSKLERLAGVGAFAALVVVPVAAQPWTKEAAEAGPAAAERTAAALT